MGALKGRDLLSLADLSTEEILFLLDFAAQLKSGKVQPKCPKALGLLFSKASTRTRVSFTVAMGQMGGQVLDLNANLTQVGRGEPIEDTARVLDRYLDVLAIRTFEQVEVETFARYAKMPVINALTDLEHPCQILADLQTVFECFGTYQGLTLTYLGDGNNIAHSLLLGCALVGLNICIAAPEGFQPLPEIVAKAREIPMYGPAWAKRIPQMIESRFLCPIKLTLNYWLWQIRRRSYCIACLLIVRKKLPMR
jgi:ornithine carbamoyltransferase